MFFVGPRKKETIFTSREKILMPSVRVTNLWAGDFPALKSHSVYMLITVLIFSHYANFSYIIISPYF